MTRTPAILNAKALRAVGWRRWLPNAITLSRLVLSAVFFVLAGLWVAPKGAGWSGGSFSAPDLDLLIAAACFGIAAGTDALDGYLARKWGAVTRFGRIMDPFADKILVVGAFVMLAGPQFNVLGPDGGRLQITGVETWMVVVILGRELLVTSIRAVLEAEGTDFSAQLTGKLKMILQAVAIPVVIVTPAVASVAAGTTGHLVVMLTMWLTVAATVASGLPYVVRGLPAFQRND
ncbi:MAG: CDP-diacylglycerol--glycerol-3-phosphate 3-phosphatidyltransferase [Planctomycetota bacterium]